MSYIIFMRKNMLQELQNEFRLVRARFAVRWTLAAPSLQPGPAFIAELLVCLHFLATFGGMVVFMPLFITVSGGRSDASVRVHPTFGRVLGATRSGLYGDGVTDVYGWRQADRGKRYRGDHPLVRTESDCSRRGCNLCTGADRLLAADTS